MTQNQTPSGTKLSARTSEKINASASLRKFDLTTTTAGSGSPKERFEFTTCEPTNAIKLFFLRNQSLICDNTSAKGSNPIEKKIAPIFVSSLLCIRQKPRAETANP
jgi:hypothetical protein